MTCVVCGDPHTVRSHIVPRAIFHDMKRPGQQFVFSRRDDVGYEYLQSGKWDSGILCDQHETVLGAVDKYGVEFCRQAQKLIRSGRGSFTLANPEPRLLVEFASACVWRMAASRNAGKPDRSLGPYAEKIQKSLFAGIQFWPLLLVARHGYRSHVGEELNIGALPYRYDEFGIRFWRFIVSGLTFDLKLDNRSTPAAMRTLDVSHATEIFIANELPQSPLASRGLSDSLLRMAVRRRSGR